MKRRRGLAGALVLVGAFLLICGFGLLALWLGFVVAGLLVGGFGMFLDYDAGDGATSHQDR